MVQRVGRGLSVVLVVLGMWLLAFTPAEPKDFIALIAVVVTCLAWWQANRSANAATRSAIASTKSAAIAEANEERSKYGWTITLHPNGDHYVLRNVGTLAAHDVRFVDQGGSQRPGERQLVLLDGGSFRARFLIHNKDAGPVIIQPGQSKAFFAYSTFDQPNVELGIDWLPEGESQRQTFTEAVPPMPNSAFEEHVKEQTAQTAAEALAAERAISETRKLLIELAAAWGEYQDHPSASNKLRVQGLVGALPGNFVKEIGHAVDVPRDHWAPDQWPLDDMVQDPNDKRLVRDNAPMIELIWNLWQVQLPPLVDADLSQPPEHWNRIEHAVHGYIELVRNRESGKRELKLGPRDRKHREEVQRRLKQAEEASRPNPQNPRPPDQSGDR
jgi:hypothetical protein